MRFFLAILRNRGKIFPLDEIEEKTLDQNEKEENRGKRGRVRGREGCLLHSSGTFCNLIRKEQYS